MNTTQHGYLLIADISGYTSFVAGTELEHAQEILSELLELIVTRFKVWLTISKIEGDAVFGYVAEERIQRGEVLLEIIETTYLAFRDRREAAHRTTTCTCRACVAIPSLDLKFIAHYGDYFVQDIVGIKELVGSDVNLVHRLLKNHISESTRWRAYALFTERMLDHLRLQPKGLHEQAETYEHLGEVKTLSFDLHARYKELTEARHIFILPEEAHVTMEYDYNAPARIVWEWFNEPLKRGQWMHSNIFSIKNIGGRNIAGSRNHCVHGNNQVIVEDVLDMHPHDYFTVLHTPKGRSASLLMTFHFTPTRNGTHLRLAFQGKLPIILAWLEKPFCKLIVNRQILKNWDLSAINRLIAASSEL